MYPIIYFDISGKCNGRCRWCSTGKANIDGKNTGCFIEPDKFHQAIQHLKSTGMLGSKTILKLFNWGEPLLHPYFREIVNIINIEDVRFGISSNASRPVFFEKPDALKNLVEVQFSMPGFSQSSYDRIHGFNFDKITHNIRAIMNNYRNSGFNGRALISYHIYQFNTDELTEAYHFAVRNQLAIIPNYAYIANWTELKQFILSEMPYKTLKRAAQELFLYYIGQRKVKADDSEPLVCPQYQSLTIDEDCNVAICCVVGKDNDCYNIGNLFDFSNNEIDRLRRLQAVCRECGKLGIHHLIHNPVISKQLLLIRPDI